MGRLKEFHFMWADAWFMIDHGYDTILENAEDGSVRLQCLVNGKPQSIDLTDRENEFIESLEQCNIRSWDRKSYYNEWIMDGFTWSFSVAYDNITIRADGTNGYPKEFERFLEVLIATWGLQESDIYCSERKELKKSMKYTRVEKMDNDTATMSSYQMRRET